MSIWLSHTDREKQLREAAAAAPHHLMSLVPPANQISGDIGNHRDQQSWLVENQEEREED